MSKRTAITIAALATALGSFTAHAEDAKNTGPNSGQQVAVDQSIKQELQLIHKDVLDLSTNLKDSFNTRESLVAAPVADNFLSASVFDSDVNIGNAASDRSKAINSGQVNVATSIALAGGTLTNFSGVSTANLNTGANAILQSPVSIAVVNIGATSF